MKTQSNRIALVAWALVAALCHVCCAPLVTAADATPAEVRRKLDEARKLIDDGRPAKAKPIVAAAAADLAALAELERVPSGVRPLIDACSELKDDLDLEGIDVAGIEIPQVKSSRPAPAKTAGPAAKPAARAMPGISFTQQVAPILVTHCGGCHVTGRKGGFQMASYEALMKTGLVQRGVGDASRIVEVIATGDMPRGGGRVSPQEMMTLVTWINAGATFDGPDPAAPLGRPAGAAPAAAEASAMNAMPVALKPGDVSFAFDIAPVLIKNCVGCHDDDQPEARLSMTTFARFSRGGESGAAFVAGRAADSLLVRKIKGSSGIEGQRMPIGKPPLTPEVIALVEKWIDQGARLDVLGPTARINDVAAAGRSRSLSHDDLKTQRFTAAEKLWQRTLPDEPPAKVTIGDIAVISNLSKSRLDEAAGSIEKAAAGVQEQLVDGAGPALKGGVACFLFAKAYDYSNFRESISGEERPKGLVGDAGVSGDVVYGAWIAPASTEENADDDLAALAAEQIAAAALLGRGAPHWFARGAGRAIATKVVPKAGVVKAWRQEAADAVGRLASPEDFFGGHSGPVVQAAVGGGFMSTLAASPAKIRSVVERIDGGAAFDAAFAEVFKGSPPTLFVAWAAQEARKPAGKR